MSVEDFGRRALGEVKETNLAELFAAVRSRIPPSGPPQSTLLGRLLCQIDHPAPPSTSSPLESSTSPVISLTSLSPESGKSHLIYLLLTHALLPSTFDGIPLHGAYSTVVLLDTDNSFSATRLAEVMIHHIKSCIPSNSPPPLDEPPRTDPAYETLITTSLHHLHVLRPQSFPSLLATLRSLPQYLADHSAHDSGPRPLWAIFLDSADAFAWEVRAAQERATHEVRVRGKFGRRAADAPSAPTTAVPPAHPAPDPDSADPPPSAASAPYTALLTALDALARRYRCRIVTAASGARRVAFPAHLPPATSSPAADPRPPYQRVYLLRTPLPERWGAWHNVRVLLEREARGARGAGSVAEAREGETRWGEEWVVCGMVVEDDGGWRRGVGGEEGYGREGEGEVVGPEEFWREVRGGQKGWVMRIGREGVEIRDVLDYDQGESDVQMG